MRYTEKKKTGTFMIVIERTVCHHPDSSLLCSIRHASSSLSFPSLLWTLYGGSDTSLTLAWMALRPPPRYRRPTGYRHLTHHGCAVPPPPCPSIHATITKRLLVVCYTTPEAKSSILATEQWYHLSSASITIPPCGRGGEHEMLKKNAEVQTQNVK